MSSQGIPGTGSGLKSGGNSQQAKGQATSQPHMTPTAPVPAPAPFKAPAPLPWPFNTFIFRRGRRRRRRRRQVVYRLGARLLLCI